MKSLSKITLFAALTAVTATACQKEDSSIDTSSGKLVKMTFTAGNPEFKPEVRTEIDGLTPYWSVGDQIGISTDGTKSNYPFTNDATERAATTTFSGNANISSRIYADYPFTANGIDKVGDSKPNPDSQFVRRQSRHPGQQTAYTRFRGTASRQSGIQTIERHRQSRTQRPIHRRKTGRPARIVIVHYDRWRQHTGRPGCCRPLELHDVCTLL